MIAYLCFIVISTYKQSFINSSQFLTHKRSLKCAYTMFVPCNHFSVLKYTINFTGTLMVDMFYSGIETAISKSAFFFPCVFFEEIRHHTFHHRFYIREKKKIILLIKYFEQMV